MTILSFWAYVAVLSNYIKPVRKELTKHAEKYSSKETVSQPNLN